MESDVMGFTKLTAAEKDFPKKLCKALGLPANPAFNILPHSVHSWRPQGGDCYLQSCKEIRRGANRETLDSLRLMTMRSSGRNERNIASKVAYYVHSRN